MKCTPPSDSWPTNHRVPTPATAPVITEGVQALRVRLGSLRLSLTTIVKEIVSIEQELHREENLKPELPTQEWLTLAVVTELFGFTTPKACRAWAKRNGIAYKKIGAKIVFKREELASKLETAPNTKRPVLKHNKGPIQDSEAEKTFSAIFQR